MSLWDTRLHQKVCAAQAAVKRTIGGSWLSICQVCVTLTAQKTPQRLIVSVGGPVSTECGLLWSGCDRTAGQVLLARMPPVEVATDRCFLPKGSFNNEGVRFYGNRSSALTNELLQWTITESTGLCPRLFICSVRWQRSGWMTIRLTIAGKVSWQWTLSPTSATFHLFVKTQLEVFHSVENFKLYHRQKTKP